MIEKIESSFKDLLASLQIAKLYGVEHLLFKDAVRKAFLSIQDILKEKDDLIIGVVGEELAFEKEVLFDLSKSIKPAIIYLKERLIEKIAFYRGLTQEELSKFIAFLLIPKEEIKKSPQETLSLMGVRNINIGRLKGGPASLTAEVSKSIDFLNMYESSLDKTSQSLDSILNSRELNHSDLQFTINNIMENLALQQQEFLKLTILKRYDEETFSHLLNVSILSMYFSSRIGFNKKDVLDIGIAALFHDIGKLYISRKILRKEEILDKTESAQIKSHSILGSRLLLGYVESLGILPVVVCFEHHLRLDMSGYPKSVFNQKPHVASLIVNICDVYDALLQRRSYKTAYSPDLVYEIMMKRRGQHFDEGLLDGFFKIMGVWPVGAVVSLSDARVALVREENEDDIFSPKVEVVHPPEKREMIDLRDAKGRIRITRYLDPREEGREYLHSSLDN